MQGQEGIRTSEFLLEIENIELKSKSLLGAIQSAHQTTKTAMGISWISRIPGLRETPAHELYRVLPPYRAALVSILEALITASSDTKNTWAFKNPDLGGANSFTSDREGVKAKSHLARQARFTLLALGLKAGGNRGGHLSRFISLVHLAAMGEPAGNWVNRYAGKAAKLGGLQMADERE